MSLTDCNYSGTTRKVIVLSTQMDKMMLNDTSRPVTLKLITRSHTTLGSFVLEDCSGILITDITIPNDPYFYQLEGFDFKGNIFIQTRLELQTPVSPPTTPPTAATSAPTMLTCPCLNGGRCIRYTRFGRKRVRCVCPYGYRGITCERSNF